MIKKIKRFLLRYKWYRRRFYEKMLEDLTVKGDFMCHYIGQKGYTITEFSELWDRRDSSPCGEECKENTGYSITCRHPWFFTHEQRLEYIREAIRLTKL